MNATRAAALSGYRPEPSGDLRENLRDRTEEPMRFRPDLRVVYRAGGRVASPARPPVAAPPVAAPPVAGPPVIRPPATASSTASPLRLTRRGRIVVAAMVALLVAGLSLAAAGAAQATGHSASQRTTSPGLVQVVVRPGQTLWSVAENADPNSDPRQVIQEIAQLNALTSGTLMAGQRLRVPRG